MRSTETLDLELELTPEQMEQCYGGKGSSGSGNVSWKKKRVDRDNSGNAIIYSSSNPSPIASAPVSMFQGGATSNNFAPNFSPMMGGVSSPMSYSVNAGGGCAGGQCGG